MANIVGYQKFKKQVEWLMPTISATGEVETRRMAV
jgi:hypothetical protein